MKETLNPEFALWTDDPALAAVALASGVDYVGPDLEQIDKRLRQPDAANLVSTHRIESLGALAEIVSAKQRFVRCNAPYIALTGEIAALLERRVGCLMLPMVRNVTEVEVALEQIRERARLIVMIEHVDVLEHLDALVALDAVHAYYVGTNDLSRSMGYRTRFGAIADGTLARITQSLRMKRSRFGFLGLARADEHASLLPVSPKLSMSAMMYLGATLFLFARSFNATPASFADQFARAKHSLAVIAERDKALLEQDYERFVAQCAVAERGAST